MLVLMVKCPGKCMRSLGFKLEQLQKILFFCKKEPLPLVGKGCHKEPIGLVVSGVWGVP